MATESDMPLTWGGQMARAERALAMAGSPAPREEAAVLLGQVVRAPVSVLVAQPDSAMSPSEAEAYIDYVARRAAGEALAHITGHLAFMGLDLAVDRESPLPSPGGKRIVEESLQWARHHAPGDLSAAEIGTGCGAIALALAVLEPRFTRVYAVDASARALKTASANGARYLLNLVVSWEEGDGLDSVPNPVDLILWAESEPSGAPVGDGSAPRAGDALVAPISPHFARLLDGAPAKIKPGGRVICGIGSPWRRSASELLSRALPTASVWVDAQGEGSEIVIAQLPHGDVRGAAFKTGR